MLASAGGVALAVVAYGFFIGFGLVSYLLPSVIAFSRHHFNRAPIFVLNLLLGWTVLGWIAAMFWAFGKQRPGEGVDPIPPASVEPSSPLR